MADEASARHIPAMSPPRRRSAEARDASIAPAAALLADPARVAMLLALVDGRALPAGELARAAGISASTASAHLARLAAAGWVGAEEQGRHRYVRLIHPDVAGLLEALAVVGGSPPRAAESGSGPPEHLRLARSCYDHLAGRAGVLLTEALLNDGSLVEEGRIYGITSAGRQRLGRLEIDADHLAEEARRSRRYLARACLDWSERRHHMAGALGAALLERVLTLGWFERRKGTRALRLTNEGRRGLWREFGVRPV
jgi:DNA-binding transcriptional ArsR family regulator